MISMMSRNSPAGEWRRLILPISIFTSSFDGLSLKLIRMAETRNLEGAAYTFQNLTGTCIACHQHVRDVIKLGDAGEAADKRPR